MRENRLSGSEGGGAKSIATPYPYIPAQGCALATLGDIHSFLAGSNTERVASLFANRKSAQLPQSCEESIEAFSTPGFQSKHFHPTRAARVGTPAWA
jgi:hypothetical protein